MVMRHLRSNGTDPPGQVMLLDANGVTSLGVVGDHCPTSTSVEAELRFSNTKRASGSPVSGVCLNETGSPAPLMFEF